MKLKERKNKDGSMSYFVDWTIGGKRRRHTFKVHTLKYAQRAYRLFVDKLDRGIVALPTEPNLTIAECLESYLESKRVHCVEKHIKTLEGRVRQIIKHFGESATVQSLREESIAKFQLAMKADGLAPPTLNRKIAIIKAAITKAVQAGKIERNPIEHIAKLSDSRAPKWCYLTGEEISRLLDVCENGSVVSVARRNGRDYEVKVAPPQGLYPLVLFLLNTGARLGEALALRGQDVNFSIGKIQILTTKRAANGRTAKPRFIPMNDTLRELLQGLERNGDNVLPRVSNVQRKFQRAVKIAGLAHCRIHDLRHTFASHLAMNGTPLNTIRELLGHSTLTMTLRYAHLSPEVTADAVQSLSFGSKKTVAKVVSVGENQNK